MGVRTECARLTGSVPTASFTPTWLVPLSTHSGRIKFGTECRGRACHAPATARYPFGTDQPTDLASPRLGARCGHDLHSTRSVSGQVDHLAARSVVFTCESAEGGDNGGIAGIAVRYRWHKTIFGRFVGFDYDRLRGGREYFNLSIYASLRYAKREDFDRLHLGAGSWAAKGYRRAVLRPLWSAFVPVGATMSAPRLELVDRGSARKLRAAITRKGIAADPGEWQLPEDIAGVGID